MNQFTNTAISASAGSGKTFRLTLRYIKLLHLGVMPEKIIALTFTKKAAGEIFNKIIDRLLIWFSDESQMTKDCEVDNIEGMTKARVFELLKKITSSQHRISVSTLDSFFFKILQSFPYEYAVNSNLEIIDEESSYDIIGKTLRELLLRELSKDEKRTLFEAFKQSTFGKEEVKVYKVIHDFVKEHYGSFKKLPYPNAWGNANITSNELKKEFKVDIEKAQLMLDGKEINSKVFAQFKEAILRANEFNKETLPDDCVKTLFERITTCDEGFLSIVEAKNENKPASIKFGRQYYDFDADIVYTSAMRYLSCIMAGKLEKSKGIYNALSLYNDKYISNIKSTGQLAFDDILSFLQGRTLTTKTTQEPNQLYIDYRLDSRYDHWLIDEFQDTSKLQWNVISNLIDEVMSDNAQKRSFFYVGDVKQAIYSWRGGDSYLFNEVKNKYQDRLTDEKLVKSYRSSKAVIETVNTLFDNLDKIEEIRPEVISLWNKNYETHRTAKSDEGYCVVYESDKKKCLEECDSELPLKDILIILNDVKALEKGLSIGILVLRNNDADEIEKYLSDNGITCSKEGNFSLLSSPAVQLFLSLVKIIHHPDDTIALGMIELSPLLKLLPNDGEKLKLNDTVKLLLSDLHTSGLVGFTENWTDKIKENVLEKDSASHKLRLEQMIYATELYGSEDLDTMDFIKYIETYKIPVKTEDKCVQIITVYKAKGLEYDMVILPKLSVGKTIVNAQISDGIQLLSDGNNQADAASLLPPRNFALSDPILAERIARLDVKYCYEQLCVLYVALTRAKQAIHIFSEKESKTSDATHLSTIINRLLTTSYSAGNPNWHTKISSEVKEKTKLKPKPIKFILPLLPINVSASKDKKFELPSFIPDSDNRALNMGVCIHEIFEHIQWLDNSNIDEFISNIGHTKSYDEEILSFSKLKLREALMNKEIMRFFTKPSKNAEIWIEKDFSLMLGNKHLKGRFDRVVIQRNANGEVLDATVIDYKYEEKLSKEEISSRYQPQMKQYSLALSKILKISQDSVRAFLILTRTSSIIEL